MPPHTGRDPSSEAPVELIVLCRVRGQRWTYRALIGGAGAGEEIRVSEQQGPDDAVADNVLEAATNGARDMRAGIEAMLLLRP